MMQQRASKRQKMLSVPHLIIIFLVALIVFGPEKLPELARKLGRATAEFRRATESLRTGFEEHMRELEREAKVAEIRRQPAENTIATPRSEPVAAQDANAENIEKPAVTEPNAPSEVHPTEVNAEKNRDGDAKPA